MCNNFLHLISLPCIISHHPLILFIVLFYQKVDNIYTITFRPFIVMQYIQFYIQSFHPHSIFSPYYFYHLSCIVIALLYFIMTRLIQCRHCMYSFFLLIFFMVERHKVKRQSSLLYDVT